jgi:TonB C terminal
MDSQQKMDVVDWQDSPLPAVLKNRAPRHFLSPTLIGILGTLLLHALVIQSVPFGSQGPKAKPQESAGTPSNAKSDPSESLVLIALATVANSNQPISQNLASSLPDLKEMKIKSPVNLDPPALVNIETLALSEDPPPKSDAGSGDRAELARLFGIYSGQIHARIERVWRRPRTPVDEDTAVSEIHDDSSFQCEAQIVQDIHGNVQEVLLPRCNGSLAWQRSLVLAIQQASPLPAPPSTTVFTRSISLQFVGLTYVSGGSEDEYEPVPRKIASSN